MLLLGVFLAHSSDSVKHRGCCRRNLPGVVACCLLVTGIAVASTVECWAANDLRAVGLGSGESGRGVLCGSDPTLVPGARASAIDFDRWYSLELQSSHAGWAHWVQTTSADTISTKLTQHLEIKRAGQVVMVESESEFIETFAGKPVSLTIVESLAAQPTTTVYLYTDRGITVSVMQGKGGTPRTSARPRIEGTWLTPAAAAVFVSQRLEAGAGEIAVRTVEIGTGPDPVLVTRQIIDKTQTQSLGKTVPSYKVTASTSRPGAAGSTELIDERGVIIRSVIRMGELQLTMTLTDAADAQSKIDPPELLSGMLVKASREIAKPRRAIRATYILTQAADAARGDNRDIAPIVPPTSIPSAPSDIVPTSPLDTSLASRIVTTGVQAVESIDARSVRVNITLDAPSPAPQGDVKDEQYRRPSAYIGSDDADVRRLARQAVATTGDSPAKKTEAVRRFVHAYITKKDLGVGFAPAAEVARTKAGDCTEHAVLVAAMLRSLDIPSRVVSGLVYVDAVGKDKHVFAYHMWAQALIQNEGVTRWVDLDATLSNERAFDATHIALLATALNDEQPQESLVKLVPLLGGLKIEVVGVGKGSGE